MIKGKLGKTIIQATPIIFLIAIMFGTSLNSPMWMDEYVFYRLASQFPDYSSTKDWFFVDRLEILRPSVDWGNSELTQEEALSKTYDAPIYPHTPFAVMLVAPVVKGLNYLADNGIMPHIEDEPGYIGTTEEEVAQNRAETMTTILRLIPMALFATSLWLIFKLTYRKVGKNAYLFAVPIALTTLILIGNYLFYWDAFMMFFFVLTLYLMEMKPKGKWHYLTACFLVNTKIFLGIAFLLPLVVLAFTRRKEGQWTNAFKMCLPALSILPFYAATVIVTGEPLYIFTHYIAQIPIHRFSYSLLTWPDSLLLFISLGIPFYLILTLPILRYFKKYPAYATFWTLGMFYAWGTGLGITHMSAMPYIGALTFPLVANEWGIMDRIQGWLKVKVKPTAKAVEAKANPGKSDE